MLTFEATNGSVPATGNVSARARNVEIGLLTGGGDKPYAFGLATALVGQGVHLDFIGSDELESIRRTASDRLRFLNLRGSQEDTSPLPEKVTRILLYYARLLTYAARARAGILHILWNNKFQTFDRTALMLYYKLCGKRLVLTVHNVNAAKRDAHDSILNRLTLRAQYRLADHLFVHTDRMKEELMREFGVAESNISTIPLAINNSVPVTDLTRAAAREALGIRPTDKALLFYGHIGPYKGLKYLAEAFRDVASADRTYRLLIVGKPKTGAEEYVKQTLDGLRAAPCADQVVSRIEFVPDEETEVYFKAADVLVLPYTDVYESGVLVLGYAFGLPVITSDVGSFRSEILEGTTGFLCKPADVTDLRRAIQTYFQSDLYHNLDCRRRDIQDYGAGRRSWNTVAETTLRVYARLLQTD